MQRIKHFCGTSRNLNICWQCRKLRIAQNHEELLGCLYAEIVTLSTGGKSMITPWTRWEMLKGQTWCDDKSAMTAAKQNNVRTIWKWLHYEFLLAYVCQKTFEEVVIASDGTFCVTRWGTGKPSVKWWLILGGCGVLQLKKFDLIATTRWKQGLFLVGCETQQASSEFDGPYECASRWTWQLENHLKKHLSQQNFQFC